MNITLIIPATGYYNRTLANPLGALSIATYLKSNGHTVKIIDRNVKKAEISEELDRFRPDIVGFSIMSSRGLKDAMVTSKAVHDAGITVVWGGQMPTMQYDLVLKEDYVDFVIMGEGEHTFYELAKAISDGGDVSSVAGLTYKSSGEIVKTPDRDFIDLSTLPKLDWSLINPPDYFMSYFHCSKMIYLYTSKGCPGCCTFCPNPVFHKSTHRQKPNALVLDEVEELINVYGVDGVYFTGEMGWIKKELMYEFCHMVHDRDLHFVWGIQTRVGQYTREELQLMYDAGCRWVIFGVESGSPEMLKKLKKGYDMNKVQSTFDDCRDIGITTVASFMVGLPDETEQQLRQTAQLALKINANLYPVYYFFPIPGTELYDYVISQGKYTPPKNLKEASEIIMTETLADNFSQVPDRELKIIRNYFQWRSLTRKDSVAQGSAFSFAKQTISDGLNAITKKGPIYFFVNGFKAFSEVASTVWYVKAYPKTKKKYGLIK